jgi:WD40 repeat protein
MKITKSKYRFKSLCLIAAIIAMSVFSVAALADGSFLDKLPFLKEKQSMSNDVVSIGSTLHEPFEARQMDFSPDGKYLVASSLLGGTKKDLEVHIWDWRHEKLVKILQRPAGSDAIQATHGLTWSPDGRFLAACLGGGRAR